MKKEKRQKEKEKAKPRPKPPPTTMILRRNATPRPAIKEQVEKVGFSHFAASHGSAVVGDLAAVAAVAQGWISPKVAAGLLIGTGVAAITASYFMDADHGMAAGTGLTTAGTLSLVNLFAADAYEAREEDEEDKRLAKEDRAKAKRLADAREVIAEAEKAKQKTVTTRNGRRLIIIDGEGNPIDYSE